MEPKHPHAARRSFVRLLWQQALWAIPFALFFGTLFGARWADYLATFRLSLVFAYVIGLATWATTYFLVPRLPRQPATGSQSPLHLALSFGLITLLASYVAALIIHFTLMPDILGDVRNILITGFYSVLFYGLFGGIRFAINYHHLAIERARAVEQARAELAQAELRALRAQINPHFLFNTLNTIASLIASNPAAAEETTTQLAELFRYALRASDRDQAPLREELDFLRGYLAVERARFGNRLVVEEAIEAGLDEVKVPTLLLQPLVENAVRYGATARPEGGRVRLSARRDGRTLVLEVADDGPGIDLGAPPSGNGFGLHSVRERLRAAGLADGLAIESQPDAGTLVRIRLPLDVVPSPLAKPLAPEDVSCHD